MARIAEIVSCACPRVAEVGLQGVEPLVEIGPGEALAERIEDVIGGLAPVVESSQLSCGTRLRPAAWA